MHSEELIPGPQQNRPGSEPTTGNTEMPASFTSGFSNTIKDQ